MLNGLLTYSGFLDQRIQTKLMKKGRPSDENPPCIAFIFRRRSLMFSLLTNSNRKEREEKRASIFKFFFFFGYRGRKGREGLLPNSHSVWVPQNSIRDCFSLFLSSPSFDFPVFFRILLFLLFSPEKK